MSRDDWPTRLLDVGIAESPIINLKETSELDLPILEYTTLSHCWGATMPIRLLSSNYAEFAKRIALDGLPKTFQDAVNITRRLGLRYLWIDALCIIQDSSSDWVKESGRMHLVYRNSYITIAAAAATDAKGGLFKTRNPLKIVPCQIKHDDNGRSEFLVSTYETEEEERGILKSLVLFTRAWVFQERLLSSRLLVFGKRELYWECLELKASEVCPKGTNFQSKGFYLDKFNLRKTWEKIHEESPLSAWRCWTTLVSQYAMLELSHISDKLVAIAGLAAHLHQTWPGVDYLAGLWSYRLRRGMLWSRYDANRSRTPSRYTAPSWSWASIDGEISTDTESLRLDGLAEVLDAQVSLSSLGNPYSAVTDGYVRLKAPLICVTLQRTGTHWQWRMRAAASQELNTADPASPSNPPLKRNMDINVMLDHRAEEPSPHAFVAYLMPAEVFLLKAETGLKVHGLVLLPTGLKQGQMRRIGYFSLQEFWRLDSSIIAPSQLHSFLSLLDGATAAAAPSTFKQRLARHEEKTLAQSSNRDELDPYGNGVVNRMLLDRYKESGICVPSITAFLNDVVVAARMERDLKEHDEDRMLYEEVCEDGYKVFHII